MDNISQASIVELWYVVLPLKGTNAKPVAQEQFLIERSFQYTSVQQIENSKHIIFHVQLTKLLHLESQSRIALID